tara:strand:+ start:482 stop:709 length:228 start_codon:yes stop_codon:yes gene_type:complete
MLIICYNMFMETFDKISDWKQLQVFIKNENLDGAEITFLMDDIHKHWEIADSFNWVNSKEYYRDLLSRLVKTYGH